MPKPNPKTKLHFAPPPPLLRWLRRLRRLLLLPAAVLAGLLPVLLWLLLTLLWWELPFDFSADVRWLTIVCVAAAPFIAGFAYCRWQPAAPVTAGARTAFWLWLPGLALWLAAFGAPLLQKTLVSLLAALLLGVAGGMSARRIEHVVQTERQKRQPAAK